MIDERRESAEQRRAREIKNATRKILQEAHERGHIVTREGETLGDALGRVGKIKVTK